MQRSSRAPVLSATLSLVSCWITRAHPSESSLRGLHDLGEPPALRLRDRTGLDDPDDVADVRLVRLVVRMERVRPPHDLLVLPVRLQRVDLDHDRLVHRVRDHGALALLPAAALVLRLLQPNDRLARRGLRDRLLRPLWPLGPR